jgi:hypothetical protein
MPQLISLYPCPAGDGDVEIRTLRQLRAIESGSDVYHNRECQNAAHRETRPCCICGAPVTRSKSKFGKGKVTCPNHRGGWKINRQTFECANPPCPNTVERTPANVHGAVYCSHTCSGEGTRKVQPVQASCAECDKIFVLREASMIAQFKIGRPVYHSKECRKRAARFYFPCAAECGRTIWRYRSVLGEGFEDRPRRIFCPECHEVHGAKKRRGTTEPCAWCEKPVYRRPSEDDGGPRYCNHECWGNALREAKSGDSGFRACIVCDRPFPMSSDRIRQDVKTCSRKCQGKLKRRKPGERYIDDKGYAWITAPDGRSMFEHRYKMEVLLADILKGEPLPEGTTVHHVNLNKSDNTTDGPPRLTPEGRWRSGNLELWVGNHPSGLRLADLIQSALVDELAEYRRRFGPLSEVAS